MKRIRTRTWAYIPFMVLGVSFALNFLAVFIFRDRIDVDDEGIPQLLMILAVLHNLGAYAHRHRDNFVMFPSFCPSRQGYIQCEEMKNPQKRDGYLREFYQMFSVNMAFLPCFLPFIFFCPKTSQQLWSFAILFGPDAIFIVWEIIHLIRTHGTRKAAREAEREAERQRKLAEEKELRDQEMREELGKWK